MLFGPWLHFIRHNLKSDILQSPEAVARIEQLLHWLLLRCLRFVRQSVREISPSMDGHLVVSAMRLIAALLPPGPPASSAEAAGPGASLRVLL